MGEAEGYIGKSALPDAGAQEEIRAAVERIVASPDFAVPERARRFLAYTVEETLAGRADRIKAYTIAIEVFGRNPSFDAQSDPVVRIEAGRVRRALEHYYLTAGAGDPITISMPKGGYVPTFLRRDGFPKTAEPMVMAEETAEPVERTARWPRRAVGGVLGVATILGIVALLTTNWEQVAAIPALEEKIGVIGSGTNPPAPNVPRLLVMPFEDLSATSNSAIVARGLTDEVIGQIAKFKEIVVIAGRSPKLSTNLAKPVRSARDTYWKAAFASKERNSA